MISVIIPVYNAEKYIIACLNSIKMQNVDLEVICVDDGSTDNSGKVIKRILYFEPFREISVSAERWGSRSKK